MIVIDHTEPNWAKKYKLSGRENGAATYSKDIVKFHVPVWRKYFPDATVSTCAMIHHKVDTDILVQYIHDNHKDDPIKDFHDVAKSAKRVIFVVAYEETRELAEKAGYEAIFLPMGIDVKKIRRYVNPKKSKKNAMIFFGNLYPRKIEEYKNLRNECTAKGIELHTISMNRYSKSEGDPGKLISQSQAWKTISEYKYAAAIGRCYHESVALGCKTLVVGQEFRGAVLSKKDHIEFSQWNYNPRTVIGDIKSLNEGLNRLDDITPYVYDASEVANVLDKSLRKLTDRNQFKVKDLLSFQAKNQVKRRLYVAATGIRLRTPSVDRASRLIEKNVSKILNKPEVNKKIPASSRNDLAVEKVLREDSSGKLVKKNYLEKEIIATPADDFTAALASQQYLDIVVSVLDKANIQYFLVPQSNMYRCRVGLLQRDKLVFLKHLIEYHKNTGLYIAPQGSKRSILKRSELLTNNKLSERLVLQDTMRLFSYTLSPKDTIFSDMDFGCDIEFWAEDDGYNMSSLKGAQLAQLGLTVSEFSNINSEDDVWLAPKRNKVSAALTKDIRKFVEIDKWGKKYKTYGVFNETLDSEVNFPIDVVYTWVDGSDAKWRKKFEKFSDVKVNSNNNSKSRYFDHQEMKYSLRSIRMFAPWVRNIYIVTDNQKPKWLDNSISGVKIVDHKDIFLDSSVLPTFNSHSIVSQLHHLEGLSENFIFFNDDVFLGKSVSPTLFFEPNGLSRQRTSKLNIGLPSHGINWSGRSSAQKNVRILLKNKLDKTITKGFTHAPAPLKRSVGYELEKLFSEEVKEVARSKFRSIDDISFGFMSRQFALVTGKAIEVNDFKSPYVDIASSDLSLRLENLSTIQPEVFCLNEAKATEDPQKTDELLHEFLEQYYPYRAPWEKD